ncbi:MAG: RhtB family transporter, partial [uncultured Solirubrobacteraceae bacterium]
ARAHDPPAVRPGRVGSRRHPGAQSPLHRHSLNQRRPAGRPGVGGRCGDRDPGPRCRRRGGALGDRRVLGRRLRRRAVPRRGVPGLPGHPGPPRRGDRRTRGHRPERFAAPCLRRWRDRQRPQPEGRAVLPGLPAPVPRPVAPRERSGRHVRPGAHRYRTDEQRRVRACRRRARRLAEAPAGLRAPPRHGRRRDLSDPRGSRRAHGQPPAL